MRRLAWLALLGLLAAPAGAESTDCLADLAGTLSQEGKQVPGELLVRQEQGNWQFSLPQTDDAGAARERLFRYHFDSLPTLDAQIIDAEQLPRVGAVMFSPFADKTADLKDLRVDCGLTADGIFLIRVDLSQAQPQLISNMLTLNAALHGQGKKPPKKFGDWEIAAARRLKYFAGEYFALEGVTSGIVSFPMRKRADAPAQPTAQRPR
jgi:hypothetical protein